MIHIAPFLLLLLLASSCSKDKEEVDIRDELSGTYTLVNGGATAVNLGLELHISKNSQQADRIDLLISQGNLQFYGTKLIREGNAIFFKIPQQASNFQGFPVFLEGEDLLEATPSAEHGHYLRDKKQLQLGLRLGIITPLGPLQSSAEVLTAIRKE